MTGMSGEPTDKPPQGRTTMTNGPVETATCNPDVTDYGWRCETHREMWDDYPSPELARAGADRHMMEHAAHTDVPWRIIVELVDGSTREYGSLDHQVMTRGTWISVHRWGTPDTGRIVVSSAETPVRLVRIKPGRTSDAKPTPAARRPGED
jgi:hypothetical protein